MTVHILTNMVYHKYKNVVKIQFGHQVLLLTSDTGTEYKVNINEVMLIEE